MASFRKEILRPGTYQKGGKKIRFTQGDLADFHASYQRLAAAGLHAPLIWEHADEGDPLGSPTQLSAIRERLADRTKHTAGCLASTELVGDRLYGNFEVPLPGDAEKLEAALVKFVSPELRMQYVDGKGVAYGKSITHVALTHKPVQCDQEPGFVQLSQAPSTAVLRLSLADYVPAEGEVVDDDVIQLGFGRRIKTAWKKAKRYGRNFAKRHKKGIATAKAIGAEIGKGLATGLAVHVAGKSISNSLGLHHVRGRTRLSQGDEMATDAQPIITEEELATLESFQSPGGLFDRLQLAAEQLGVEEADGEQLSDPTDDEGDTPDESPDPAGDTDTPDADDNFGAQDDGEPENPDLPEDQEAAKKTAIQFEALLAHLAQIKIPLPSDTTPENLVDRLLTALMVANAREAEDAKKEGEEDEQEQQDDSAPVEETPMLNQLSQESARKRVKALAKHGRITPALRDRLLQEIKPRTVRLSEGGTAEVATLSLDTMLQILAKQPKLSAFQASEGGDPARHPKGDAWFNAAVDGTSPEQAKEELDKVLPARV